MLDWLQWICLSGVSAAVLGCFPLSAAVYTDVCAAAGKGRVISGASYLVKSQATFVSMEAPSVPIGMIG